MTRPPIVTDEVVERVANAMLKAQGNTVKLIACDKRIQRSWRKLARAAIAEIGGDA